MPDEPGPPPPPRDLPPAGWYPDPESPESSRRYWDGDRWTDSQEQNVEPSNPPRDLGVAEGVVVAGMTLIAVLGAFSIVADARYIGALNELIDGGSPEPGEVGDARDLVDAATLAFSLAVFPLGPAVFLPWFYRAYTNLGRFGLQDLRFTPGWSVAAWFIPILNLFRPKQIAD
ncbi:MAG TPA: DUF4328 domain-containing protein, partial [Solirubrobacterales bacterium]|nr:DUF4328 domain-containing protein [Solirubrobacterales bacterium]